MASDDNGKVGYKNPPLKSRFKPGRSGNPKGRPRGSRNMTTLLDEELRKPVSITEYGRSRKIPKGKAIVKRLAEKALNGDLKALVTIFALLRPRESGQPDTPLFDSEIDRAIIEDALQRKRP